MNAPIVVGGKSPHSRPIQNRKPHGRSRLTNKKDLLPGVDGRTVIYRGLGTSPRKSLSIRADSTS